MAKRIVKLVVFIFLTVLTQVGGIIYLLSVLTYAPIQKYFQHSKIRTLLKISAFIFLYLFFTFLIIPILAKPFGRVPMPIVKMNNLCPLTSITVILNRHYVRPALKEAVLQLAADMNKKYPDTEINYLDANFPFINKFPLLPHLSHNDGKKLDLAFCYKERKTNLSTNDCPSFLGYGICEEPNADEKNTTAFCSENGYWQYSFLTHIIPQSNKANFLFDAEKTKDLVGLLSRQETIGKIFIEPHLKERMQLRSDKIKFHGCQAVRHDDHIHIQLK